MTRTKKYQPIEFQQVITSYFLTCVKKKKVPTKGGLALTLDLTREALGDYEKYEDYSDSLKKAYELIEENWVQKLAGNNVAGTIFYLKNAFKDRWRDKQETEHSGQVSLTQTLAKDGTE